ncbi:50S ribosomal protein L17 [Hymenobacter sp. ISL-91]|uniref:Large ribosomal subunit protein bL17 n=1 Tax=Hymenobacter terrestris TaxID=2748310 RepID=A0ABX2PYI4_9BACT|nr:MULTISPECIES: 50S ribosomal protein L17 [Hymenobacter]MBT2558937.1 50S ribosomal protein L17 [Hymenobacter sp. ISL-91]NVO83749.1 50S ribosomal protein L17 [Hymenobacter terrestris]
MRHGKSFNHLGRTTSHRHAMLANMANSLILHKRITTTVAKAKALRQYVEPLLTKAKNDTTHSRRLVFSSLGQKEVLKELFDNVAAKIAGRPGGYTRIIKLSQNRLGDNSEMCVIELVDFNDTMLEAKNAGEAKATTRRSRRGGKKADATTTEGDSSAEVVAEAKPAKKAKAATTEVSAPEDTDTETLKDGETREEKAAE